MAWIKSEVPLLAGLVSAVLALIVSFGFTITPDQTAAIMGVVAVVVSLITRSQVSPKA